MKDKNVQVQNDGQNSGIMVAENYGDINVKINKAIKIPSLIANLVKLLGDTYLDEEIEDINDFRAYKINEKIEYNCVIKYKPIIEKFSIYYSVCENHLNVYDNLHVQGKTKILRCVNLKYLNVKGEILRQNKESKQSEIEIIKENSDEIIDKVVSNIKETIIASGEFDSITIEEIELGLACFICFCFMECEILEKPI